jgi:hypothetical protein
MNEPFSIVPPPELVKQWVTEVWHEGTPARLSLSDMHIAGQAATWGADAELNYCCDELSFWGSKGMAERLRSDRRPKPPSLKEQALEELEQLKGDANSMGMGFDAPAIRRALEALDA